MIWARGRFERLKEPESGSFTRSFRPGTSGLDLYVKALKKKGA